MSPDPQRVAEARAWFTKAADDLRAAEFELTARPPLNADIVFHCQQAVEKTLKGFLAWHDRPFRKTHDLVELGRACADIETSLQDRLRRAAPLTEYAWRFRYPGDPDEPSREETEGAVHVAHEVYGAVLERVPGVLHPG